MKKGYNTPPQKSKYKAATREPITVESIMERVDEYAKSDDESSLNSAFMSYFTAGVLYGAAGEKKSEADMREKADGVVKKLAGLKGLSKKQVLEQLLHQYQEVIPEALKIAKNKHYGRTVSTVVASIGIFGGLLFLSTNLTGYVVSSAVSSSNTVGALFLIFGLAGLLAYFKY